MLNCNAFERGGSMNILKFHEQCASRVSPCSAQAWLSLWIKAARCHYQTFAMNELNVYWANLYKTVSHFVSFGNVANFNWSSGHSQVEKSQWLQCRRVMGHQLCLLQLLRLKRIELNTEMHMYICIIYKYIYLYSYIYIYIYIHTSIHRYIL